MSLKWLQWAQTLQSIAQNGLTYSENPFDRDRFVQVRQVAAEIMAAGTGLEPEFIQNLFSQEEGYATPKVDVRGVVFDQDRLLLVQERDDGGWTLPGGWVDVGESPSRAIEREVWEESGYRTRAVKLLAVYDRDHPRHGFPPFRHQVYKLFFRCELLGGESTQSIETTATGFFAQHEIPPLSLTRVVPSQIDRVFEHLHHPSWPTDFD